MDTSNLLSNLLQGNSGAVNAGIANIGTKPVGNAGGSQLPKIGGPVAGPVGTVGGTTAPIGIRPTGGPSPTPTQSNTAPIGIRPTPATTGSNNNPMPTFGSGVTPPTGAAANGAITIQTGGGNTVTVDTTSGAFAGMNQGQIQEILKQYENIYGHGTGALLFSQIANLGSSNDSYMKAYEAAMAGPNAENLATLNTTLGNSGASASSSAAAIANADYQSNITAQEGLQEQQLQMQDKQDMLGLLTNTMNPAAKEAQAAAANTPFSTFLSTIGDVATIAGDVAGFGGVGGLFGASQGTQQSALDSLDAIPV